MCCFIPGETELGHLDGCLMVRGLQDEATSFFSFESEWNVRQGVGEDLYMGSRDKSLRRWLPNLLGVVLQG